MTEIAKSSNKERPDARRVILNLLGVTDDGTLAVDEAIGACTLFGISDNSARVTLARLSQAKLIEPSERGVYRLGPGWREIASDVAGWRTAEDRLVPWDGRWVAVATGGLPRSNRKVLRARHRALSMLGMRELDYGLFIRPDNRVGGVDAVRKRLVGLGLERQAAVFRADQFDSARQTRSMTLWAGDALVLTYREDAERLEAWSKDADALPLHIAARDSFILGDNAIRKIVFDPMLPTPLVDEEERHNFIAAMVRFDELGRRIWTRFLGRPENGSR